ncbi:MAG: DUF3040 domain-containing protein [bacterium]|nr:DUF3040 domain-containing protein [bacterium]
MCETWEQPPAVDRLGAEPLSNVKGARPVALSEDEQRILSEIEANLYETDPELAEEVRSTTVFRHGFRNLRRSVLGFIAGIVFMIFTLSTSFWLSFVGFLIMLASAMFFERNARLVGKAGLQQISRNPLSGAWRDEGGTPGQRMRDRFNRDQRGD